MSRLEFLQFGPFGGLVTALDAEFLGPENAADLQNVVLNEVMLKPRNGYDSSRLTAALASTTNIRGMFYVAGYDDTQTFVEEYLVFIKAGGTLKPYSVNPVTGARTVITDGGTPLSLTDGEWQVVEFNGFAYAFTPGHEVYKHQIGDATSWEAMDPGQPNQQTDYPQVTFEKTETDTEDAPTTIDWTGFAGGDLTNNDSTPSVAFVSETGGVVRFTAQGPTVLDPTDAGVDFSMVAQNSPVDMSAATQFTFELSPVDGDEWNTSALSGDPHTITHDFGTAWTSPGNLYVGLITTAPVAVDCTIASCTASYRDGKWVYLVTVTIPSASRGSAVSAIDQVRIAFYRPGEFLGASTLDRDFTITSPMFDEPAAAPTPDLSTKVRFSVVAYNEEYDVEAVNPTNSAEYRMDADADSRYFTLAAPDTLLGNIATIHVPSGAMTDMEADAGVTHWRAYVRFSDESNWRYLDQIEVGSSNRTYEVPFSLAELRQRPFRKTQEYNAVGNIVSAGAFRNFMCWGKAGGETNLQFSKVGQPNILAKVTDNSDPEADYVDQYRGASFTMSDNFEDEPVCHFQAADSLIHLGKNGAYSQRGQTPITLTPPKRLAGTYGVFSAGAACRWKDDSGRSAVYYLDSTGTRVWEINVYSAADVENDERVVEVSLPIRGAILSHLFSGTLPTSDDDRNAVRMVPDFKNDRLMLFYRNRCLALDMRPLGSRKKRPWLFWNFANQGTNITFERFSATLKYGFRETAIDGSITEVFYRYNSGAFTAITGALADGGTAMPTIFWKSGRLSGPARKISNAQVEKVDITETVNVQDDFYEGSYSGSDTAISGPNVENARFRHVKGFDHQFTVTLPDGSEGVRRVTITQEGIGGGGLR